MSSSIETSHLWQLYQQNQDGTEIIDIPSVQSQIFNQPRQNQVGPIEPIAEEYDQVSRWDSPTREPTATSLSGLRVQSTVPTQTREAWTSSPISREHSEEPMLEKSQSARLKLVSKTGRQLCQTRLSTVLAISSICLLLFIAVGLPLGLVYGYFNNQTTRTSDTSTTILPSTASLLTTQTATSTTVTTTTVTTTTTTTSPQTAWIPSNYNQTCLSTATNVTTVTPSALLASWPFELNTNDISGNGYNGQPVNSPTYVTGYIGEAIQLQNTLAQYVSVPYINLINRSFTVEGWFYLYSLITAGDLDIFGQCQTPATDICLHYVIRQDHVYLGFHSDDLSGATNLTANAWYHIAYVYDYTSNTKSVYLNGVSDGNSTTGNAYQGVSGNSTIGSTAVNTANSYWNGIIDQLTITNRAKTAFEILNDASLLAHFQFDSSFSDVGPNSMTLTYNGQGNNGLAWVIGRVNQALSFNATTAYVESCGYYSLGQNKPYSVAMWVKPWYQGGTLFHLASASGGSGAWCFPLMGFSSNGSLVIQTWDGSSHYILGPILPVDSWSHIVQTWSSTNGLRLYLNGGLYGSLNVLTFAASGSTMCFLVGTSGFGTNCQTAELVPGSYSGVIDEVYVYNRELASDEICPLAHP